MAGIGAGCATMELPPAHVTRASSGRLVVTIAKEALTPEGFDLSVDYAMTTPLLLVHVIETLRYTPLKGGGEPVLRYRSEWWEWFEGAPVGNGFHEARGDRLRSAPIGPWSPDLTLDFECVIERMHEYYLNAEIFGQRPRTRGSPEAPGDFGVLAEGPHSEPVVEEVLVGNGANSVVHRPSHPSRMLEQRSGVVQLRGQLVGHLRIVSMTRWAQQHSRSWKVSWTAHRSVVGERNNPTLQLEVRGRGPTINVEGREMEYETIPAVPRGG